MQSEQFRLHAEIEQRHWWFVARRQILRAVIQTVLSASRETTIVDVGCGTGANLAALADDYRCVGIDTSAEAIELARGRFAGVQFIHGFAPGDLGDIAAQARLVMLCDVLEHVPDDFALLSDLLAATRAGAYFLITVPANQSLWTKHDEVFGHYRRYDAPRLARLWQGLNVRPVFVSHFNTRLYPAIRAVRWWNALRGHTSGAAGSDFQMPRALVNRSLTTCFAGEARRLSRLAQGAPVAPYRRGVSLMALVQRTAGAIDHRDKPLDVAPDFYDPATHRELAVV